MPMLNFKEVGSIVRYEVGLQNGSVAVDVLNDRLGSAQAGLRVKRKIAA